MSVYREPAIRDNRVSLAILLPSRITENKQDLNIIILDGTESDFSTTGSRAFKDISKRM